MMIWLGKQWLGQKEQVFNEFTGNLAVQSGVLVRP